MNAAMSRAAADLKRMLRIKPYRHQSVAAARGMACLQAHGSFALLHDMGSGKTLTTLGIFSMLVESAGASTMLVVCPASVIGSWEKECQSAGIDCLALTGPVARREARLTRALLEMRAPLVIVTNYEGVWRMEGAMKVARFDLAVCDESQRIKAPGSKQSRAMHRIGKTAKHRMILSGTPIPEGPLDYYAQFRYLDERVLGSSYVNFKSKYAVERDFGTFRKVVATKNLDDLEMRVMSRAHRVSKEDALDLPDEVDIVRYFDLSPAGAKAYDQLARDSVALIEDDFGEFGEVVAENVLTRILRLQQMTSGFAALEDGTLHPVDDGKLGLLREVAKDLMEAGEKFVVFHRFTADGQAIVAELEKLGCAPVAINGAVPASVRGEAVRRFQEDDDCRAFVGQIQASGLGITLTAARTTIFYSLGYSGADFEQAKARVHRIGQDRKVNHLYLVARGTVDEAVLTALRAKKRVADDMTDGAWKRWFVRIRE